MSKIVDRVKKKICLFFSSHHGLAEVMRFADYSAIYDNESFHLIEDGRSTTVLPSEYYDDKSQNPQTCKLPDMYWMRLVDCRIIGGSEVVLTSNCKLLYDLLATCKQYDANVTDYGLFLLFGHPHRIGKKYIYNYQKKEGERLKNGINLASNMSNNYFHFMFQVASKMAYIKEMNVDKDVPLLVDERVLSVPQMKFIIESLNDEGRVIIPLKENVCYHIQELYIIGNPNIVVPNSNSKFQADGQSNAFAYDIKAIDFIKERILSTEQNGNNYQIYPERIYLSRRNCNKRQVNEDDLRPILKKYGFEFVYTERMSVVEQAQMFRQAKHIIGASGAAFTNLLFCDEGCRVLILISRKHNSTCFSSLGNLRNARIQFIAGNSDSSQLHTPFFSISPEILEHYLISIYGLSNQR